MLHRIARTTWVFVAVTAWIAFQAPTGASTPDTQTRPDAAAPPPAGSARTDQPYGDRPDAPRGGRERPSTPDKASPPPTARLQPQEGGAEAAAPASRAAIVLEPSQGRPIFITPDETFYLVLRLTEALRGDVNLTLVHALEPSVRAPLMPATPPSYVKDYCSLLMRVPAGTQPGLYDIEVRSKSASHFARHSVRVVDQFKSRFRFIHLSSMNVGDLSAPEFDEALPREINILAPEFIIATGDYTQWARTRDDEASWERVLAYFQKFNAPVFMLCGLHDHEASFTRFVAAKPFDKFSYGQYQGLLLLDHAANPIEQDYNQLKWIDDELKRGRNKRMNFMCANSDELALLDIWRERGDLAETIDKCKVRLFITGGATDWDQKEFADKLKGLDRLAYIRTHAASTCLKDRATGVPHYRVIEIDGDQVAFTYPDDTAAENLLHSIPSGRLRAFYDGPNDGSASRVSVTFQNALNQPFSNCRAWLRVAKRGDAKPAVAPGRIEQTVDAGKYWACEVAFDLPDKGGTRLMLAGSESDLPAALPITAALDGLRTLSFTPQTTDFGLSYFSCDAPVKLQLTNTSKSEIACWPVIRLNGDQIHPDRTACPRLPVTIAPGATLTMPLVLNLRRVSPGKHQLQVHFLEDPLSRVHSFEVELRHRP